MKYNLAIGVLALSAVAGAVGLVSPVLAQTVQPNATIALGGSDVISVETAADLGSGDLSVALRKPKEPKPTHGAPAPLIAGGIPGLLALGGAYLAVRRRRRRS